MSNMFIVEITCKVCGSSRLDPFDCFHKAFQHKEFLQQKINKDGGRCINCHSESMPDICVSVESKKIYECDDSNASIDGNEYNPPIMCEEAPLDYPLTDEELIEKNKEVVSKHNHGCILCYKSGYIQVNKVRGTNLHMTENCPMCNGKGYIDD
jgi:hypothetical protein